MSDRSVRPTQEEFSLRAYEIYVSHGRQNGGDLDDGLTAEQELREQQPSTSETKRPALIVTGAVLGRTVLLTEQTPQYAGREHVVRESPARENTSREAAERESETHFKLPRRFSGSNP